MSVTCFTVVNSLISTTPSFTPCGNLNSTTPILPCCDGVDTCVTGGLCFHEYSAVGESGYYASGCTSSDVSDPACFPRCQDEKRPDVVWNTTAQIWHCCGTDSSGNPNCGDPTKETFAAPAPASLATYFKITSGFVATSTSLAASSTSSAASSTSSSPPSTPTTALPSSTAHSGSSRSISSGAAAGIGVGSALAAIIIVALVARIIVLSLRKRRRRVEAITISMEAPTRTHELEARKVEAPMGLQEIGPGR
ncbi:hypothetical protein BGZ57DRAFT_433516 [Hyaloscypha finlandica]|nr:hypothetical protein BGZ57DRAFT_433516 [Hyaloscypha finlandica]